MLKITLELDYESEAELFDSYLWQKFLSKAVECNKCVSFETDTHEYFGEVRWHDEDIANELELLDYPHTPEAVSIVKADLDNHWFTDHIIGAGFEYIDSIIRDHHDALLSLDAD